MLAGVSVAALTLGQFLFLGLSVMFLGILIHVTAAMILQSVLKPTLKQLFEILLVLFVVSFFSLILMDYWGILKIPVMD